MRETDDLATGRPGKVLVNYRTRNKSICYWIDSNGGGCRITSTRSASCTQNQPDPVGGKIDLSVRRLAVSEEDVRCPFCARRRARIIHPPPFRRPPTW